MLKASKETNCPLEKKCSIECRVHHWWTIKECFTLTSLLLRVTSFPCSIMLHFTFPFYLQFIALLLSDTVKIGAEIFLAIPNDLRPAFLLPS